MASDDVRRFGAAGAAQGLARTGGAKGGGAEEGDEEGDEEDERCEELQAMHARSRWRLMASSDCAPH